MLPILYYYAVLENALVELRQGSFLDQVGRGLERPGEIENAAAVILLSNVFHRYTWRYGNRGYRYALIDTGHIGENLRLAAVAAGFGEAGALRFHDDLFNRLLELDGGEEAVCTVHALGHPRDAESPASGPVRRFVEKQDASRAPRDEGNVSERFHEATKLVPGEETKGRSSDAPAEGAQSGPGVTLARSGPTPAMSVERAIHERRSAIHFGPTPLALDDLGFVLEMARGHPALERASGVELYVVAHRVSGLDAGLYRSAAKARRLDLLRPGDLSRPMVRACLGQRKAGSAAAGLVMVGRLPRAASGPGGRRYRDLLIEAGGIGQRIYLAAEAVGLVARNLAAFLDDDFNKLLGLDGRRHAVLHLTMLGHGR